MIFLLGLAASFALDLPAGAPLSTTAACGARRPGTAASRWQTARMQDTAEGFGQPIRQIFEPFFRMQRELPSPFDVAPRYRVVVEDPLWDWLYLPVADVVERLSRAGRPAAAGPHRDLPALQLRLPLLRRRCCWCVHAELMHLSFGILSQLLEIAARARCSRRC